MTVPEAFKVQVLSDEDYENLIAEVLFNGELVFLVSQEEGFENLRISIHPRKSGEPWDFSFADVMQVMQKARDRLQKLLRAP